MGDPYMTAFQICLGGLFTAVGDTVPKSNWALLVVTVIPVPQSWDF
jgi:hypothetical protein